MVKSFAGRIHSESAVACSGDARCLRSRRFSLRVQAKASPRASSCIRQSKRWEEWRAEALIELLIASGVFLISITSVFAVVFSGRSSLVDNQLSVTATEYARQGLEASRLIRDTAWADLTDGTHGATLTGANWTFSGTSDSQAAYTRQIAVASVSANTKTVTSTVSWQLNGQTKQLALSTLLTNWRNTQTSNYLAGDWQHPTTVGSADVDSGVAATDVRVESNKVYLSSQSSNQAKADFSIFDVASLPTVTQNSSVDLGISNLSSIAKSGHYVYGSIAGSTDEFMVIDVTDPANPVKVKSLNFSNGRSTSTAVSGATLFVGMEAITGEPEFYAFNVADPLNPVQLGSFEVNGTVNAIRIFNNRAYIATSNDAAELMVLDVANPSVITKLGEYNAPGPEDGTALFVKDEFNVYLGRDQSTTAAELSVFNASDPATISLKGSTSMATRVNDLVVVNRLAFIITEESNAELRILDISDPAAITFYSSMNFPQAATGVDYDNNRIYVSVRSNNALRIIGPS